MSIQFYGLLRPDPLAGSRAGFPKSCFFPPLPKTRTGSYAVSSAITCQAALACLQARRAIVEVPVGQEVQSQQLGEKEGVGDVVGVFHPVVGLHPRRTGQHHVVAVILKTIHKPLPVEGGFHGDGGDPLLVGFEHSQNGGQ